MAQIAQTGDKAAFATLDSCAGGPEGACNQSAGAVFQGVSWHSTSSGMTPYGRMPYVSLFWEVWVGKLIG